MSDEEDPKAARERRREEKRLMREEVNSQLANIDIYTRQAEVNARVFAATFNELVKQGLERGEAIYILIHRGKFL